MRRICIFDWTGTIVDKQRLAPLKAFIKTLNQFGINNRSDEEIKKYMGMDPFYHLFKLLGNVEMTRNMYPYLTENLKQSFHKYSTPVPYTNDVFKYLKSRGYMIGSCSEYDREILEKAIDTSRFYGMIIPQTSVASDEVKISRPGGDMIKENIKFLSILNGITVQKDKISVIKVGDTIEDIQEGVCAKVEYNIGISSDKNTTIQMYKQGATHVITNIEDLFRIL